MRRQRVVELLVAMGMGRSVQARIARLLGVSDATICRDVAAIWEERQPCPACKRPLPI